MSISHSRFLLFLFALISLALGSCDKEVIMPPVMAKTAAQQLTTGRWRLDQIRQVGANGSVTTGADIKDRYVLTFRENGTYQQQLMADGTTFNGTWMLMSNNTVLHFTDHKGTDFNYQLVALTATELRYSYDTPNFLTVERVFSAQP